MIKNPFLPVALFRTAEDDKKIETYRREEREGKASTEAGFSYGWFSQRTADAQGFYEEWGNLDGVTLAVTHTSHQLLTVPPVQDARYSGVVVDFQRRVNSSGEPVSAEPFTIIVNGRKYRAGRGTLQSLSEVVDQYLTGKDFRVRVEEDGHTVAEGPVAACTNFSLKPSSNYTIVFEPIEKPVERIVEKQVFVDRPVVKEVIREVPVYGGPPPPPPPPGPSKGFFVGTVSQQENGLVDQALTDKIKPSAWLSRMDCEGTLHATHSQLLQALTSLYSKLKDSHDWRRHTITAQTTPSVRSRAERMRLGAEIVVMASRSNPGIWVPFASMADWREAIGTVPYNTPSV